MKNFEKGFLYRSTTVHCWPNFALNALQQYEAIKRALFLKNATYFANISKPHFLEYIILETLNDKVRKTTVFEFKLDSEILMNNYRTI